MPPFNPATIAGASPRTTSASASGIAYTGMAAQLVAPKNRQKRPAPANGDQISKLIKAKKFTEALPLLNVMLAADPDHVDYLYLKGLCHFECGEHDACIVCFDKMTATGKTPADLLLSSGNLRKNAGDYHGALDHFSRVVEQQPDHAEALNSTGVILFLLHQFEMALQMYARALAITPDNHLVMNNFGNALRSAGKLHTAAETFKAALTLQPDHVESQINLAITLSQMSQDEQALSLMNDAIERKPDHAGFVFNRGNLLWKLQRHEQALDDYDRSIALEPPHILSMTNKAQVLAELHRFDESRQILDQTIAHDPHCAKAFWNLAIHELREGNYRDGFQKFDWRFKNPDSGLSMLKVEAQEWRGDFDLAGRTILVHWEQGLGDTIQFVRFLPELVQMGAQVILEAQAPLVDLLGSMPVMKTGAVKIIAAGAERPDFDCYVMLMNLPAAVDTTLENLPYATGYLSPQADKTDKWQDRLQEAGIADDDRPKIGLVWSGSLGHRGDKQRSLELARLVKALPANASYVSLQKEVRDDDLKTLQAIGSIAHFGDELKDFGDTAALVSHMDVVISVDTSVAHLAGALGRPVWVLLPHLPDWRWLMGRDDSPWYDQARLFRQQERGVWDDALDKLGRAITEQFCNQHQH